MVKLTGYFIIIPLGIGDVGLPVVANVPGTIIIGVVPVMSPIWVL